MKKSKQEIFKEALENFKDSKQTSQDYLDFIQATVSVTRQGDGLLWSQVIEILDKVV